MSNSASENKWSDIATCEVMGIATCEVMGIATCEVMGIATCEVMGRCSESYSMHDVIAMRKVSS